MWSPVYEEMMKESKRKGRNMGDFKVRCIRLADIDFTIGKVYEVKNGVLLSDNRPFKGKWTKDIELINSFCCPHAKFELVTEPKQFTKADLRTGMRVELKNGTLFLVLKDFKRGELVNHKGGCSLEYYGDNLKDLTDSDDEDIVKVFDVPYFCSDLLKLNVTGDPIWQRTEPKKVTKSEICKALDVDDFVIVEG